MKARLLQANKMFRRRDYVILAATAILISRQPHLFSLSSHLILILNKFRWSRSIIVGMQC